MFAQRVWRLMKRTTLKSSLSAVMPFIYNVSSLGRQEVEPDSAQSVQRLWSMLKHKIRFNPDSFVLPFHLLLWDQPSPYTVASHPLPRCLHTPPCLSYSPFLTQNPLFTQPFCFSERVCVVNHHGQPRPLQIVFALHMCSFRAALPRTYDVA